MSDAYSRNETDAKLALVEERLDHKFDRLLAEIKENFLSLNAKIDYRFDLIEKDISWLKLSFGVVLIPMGIAIITLCITVLYHR